MSFSPMLMTEMLAEEHRNDLKRTAASHRRSSSRVASGRAHRLLGRLLHHRAA